MLYFAVTYGFRQSKHLSMIADVLLVLAIVARQRGRQRCLRRLGRSSVLRSGARTRFLWQCAAVGVFDDAFAVPSGGSGYRR